MPETDKYALPERPSDPRILFVGGTGRSGTHILSQLLEHHSRYARVPIEARFHVNPQGFPDLLSGAATPEQFLRKLKKFWWRRIRAGEVAPVLARRLAFGRKVRGLHKVVPEERFEAAVAAFERDHPADLESRLPQPLPRSALAAGDGGGQARADRDELLHDRRRARRCTGSSRRRS